MSDPGHSSRRAYDPSATSAQAPDSGSAAAAPTSSASTSAASARPNAAPRYSASGPTSPVRIRHAFSTGTIQTLPSPI